MTERPNCAPGFSGIRLAAPPILIVAAACALTACITAAEQANRWTFTCPDGYEFTATFARDGDSVAIDDESLEFDLDRERSASGALYTDGTTVFWNKGVMARVETGDGSVHQDCQGDSI